MYAEVVKTSGKNKSIHEIVKKESEIRAGFIAPQAAKVTDPSV